jgi:[ribosomal protein S5]-alanine N-acetyltransferase
MPPSIIETERLLLRPLELSDAGDIQRLAGNRSIADTTINIPHPYENGMAEQWITLNRPEFAAGMPTNFAIVLRGSGKLVGAIELRIVPRSELAELGYWVGKPYWHKGYGTEAARAMIHYGFTALNIDRIHAAHFTRNPASGRVLQKIGMRHEGRSPKQVEKWGQPEKLELYGLFREQWLKSTAQTQSIRTIVPE